MPSHPPVKLTPQAADDLVNLSVELLCDLVRLDTSNPPGNEIIAARYLADRFAAEGLAPQIIEPSAGRGNIIVRLPAGHDPASDPDQAIAGLLLLSHLDVVPAEPASWTWPPFAAEIEDGYIWGRGTIDTKNLTAIEAAVVIMAKRLGVPLRKDIVFAATANEESGGDWGARWLADHQLDLIRAEAAINEGGGVGVHIAGKLLYTLQTAEKAPCPVTITAAGMPGHASTPTEDNPIVTLSRALVAIGSRRLPVHITDTYRQFVETLAKCLPGPMGEAAKCLLDPNLADTMIAQVAGDPGQAATMRAMIRNTATPTVVQAGYKVNVIPGAATAQIDCRLLPGSSPTTLLAELNEVLAAAGLSGTVELSAAEVTAPSMESPFTHPLVETIAATIASRAAGASLVPFMVPGATDGRYLRPKGIPVYGFCPMPPGEEYGRAHGHDERISLAGLRFGAVTLWDIVNAYCG